MDSLKAKLHLAEANLKSFETLAVERAHQISSLEKDCQVKDERLANMEEACCRKEERTREVDTKMAATAEKLSALQVEKERLTQQVHHSPHDRPALYSIMSPFPFHIPSHTCRWSLVIVRRRRVVPTWHMPRAGLMDC